MKVIVDDTFRKSDVFLFFDYDFLNSQLFHDEFNRRVERMLIVRQSVCHAQKRESSVKVYKPLQETLLRKDCDCMVCFSDGYRFSMLSRAEYDCCNRRLARKRRLSEGDGEEEMTLSLVMS